LFKNIAGLSVVKGYRELKGYNLEQIQQGRTEESRE
jgi:hypothetical protein